MFMIRCPWCGDCDGSEFSYGGDASRTRPAPDADQDTWYDYVYLRDNPKGPHDEYWQHVNGCRQWIKVRRDVVSHQVLATGTPQANLDEVAS